MPSPRESLKNRKPARKPRAIPQMHLLHPAPELPRHIMDSARMTIAERLGTDPSQDQPIYEMLQRMQHHRVQQTKLTREEHLARIMEAYASYVYFSHHPEFDQFIARLAAELGINLSKKTHPLKVIVQTCIWYGENKGSNRNASKLYSRDVQAILHLIDRGIPPTDGVDLAQKPENGLDAWARAKNPKEQQEVEEESPAPNGETVELEAAIGGNFDEINAHRTSIIDTHTENIPVRTRTSAIIEILSEKEKDIICEFIVLTNSRYRAGPQSSWSNEDLEVWSRVVEFLGSPSGYKDDDQ